MISLSPWLAGRTGGSFLSFNSRWWISRRHTPQHFDDLGWRWQWNINLFLWPTNAAVLFPASWVFNQTLLQCTVMISRGSSVSLLYFQSSVANLNWSFTELRIVQIYKELGEVKIWKHGQGQVTEQYYNSHKNIKNIKSRQASSSHNQISLVLVSDLSNQKSKTK